MLFKFNSDDLQSMLPQPFMPIARTHQMFKRLYVEVNMLVQVVFDLVCRNVLLMRRIWNWNVSAVVVVA